MDSYYDVIQSYCLVISW